MILVHLHQNLLDIFIKFFWPYIYTHNILTQHQAKIRHGDSCYAVSCLVSVVVNWLATSLLSLFALLSSAHHVIQSTFSLYFTRSRTAEFTLRKKFPTLLRRHFRVPHVTLVAVCATFLPTAWPVVPFAAVQGAPDSRFSSGSLCVSEVS